MTGRLPASLHGLPASLVDVAEALGPRVALKLMQSFGGEELRIPKTPPGADHPIVKALGEADGRALCLFLADTKLYVPHGRSRNLRRYIAEMEAKGLARREIARRLKLSQRHVRRLANRAGDPRQASLFDDKA